MEWMRDVAAEELPEPYQTLVRLVGMEATMAIAEEFGGLSLYFPKLDRLSARLRDERIRAEYKDGYTIQELARRYGLSDRRIREIISEENHPDQLPLFPQSS